MAELTDKPTFGDKNVLFSIIKRKNSENSTNRSEIEGIHEPNIIVQFSSD